MSAEIEQKKPDNSYEARLERLRDELTGPSVSEVIQKQKAQQDRLFNKTKSDAVFEAIDELDPVLVKESNSAQANSTVVDEDDIISPDDEKYESKTSFLLNIILIFSKISVKMH